MNNFTALVVGLAIASVLLMFIIPMVLYRGDMVTAAILTATQVGIIGLQVYISQQGKRK